MPDDKTNEHKFYVDHGQCGSRRAVVYKWVIGLIVTVSVVAVGSFFTFVRSVDKDIKIGDQAVHVRVTGMGLDMARTEVKTTANEKNIERIVDKIDTLDVKQQSGFQRIEDLIRKDRGGSP